MCPASIRRSGLAAAALALGAGLAEVHAITLEPIRAGLFLDGDGALSRWVQVSGDWRGEMYGGEPWGDGIWGLVDHAAVMVLDPDDPAVVGTLTARVDRIDFADAAFNANDALTQKWGTLPPLPELDGAPGPLDPGFEDNFAVSFRGHIAVTEAGPHNFGLLSDDGFRFSLFGRGGESLTIQSENILRDALNPPERVGFDEDLWLSPGLYPFELDAYDRLEAGVIQLTWWTPGAGEPAVVPRAHLYTHETPIPPAFALGLSAFGSLLLLSLGRRRRAA